MEIGENLGTKVVLENERLRIWEHRVPPGGTGPLHVHRRPYFSVFVLGATGDTLDADGNVIEHFVMTPGTVYWSEDLPETHALRNTGDDDILIVTTELL